MGLNCRLSMWRNVQLQHPLTQVCVCWIHQWDVWRKILWQNQIMPLIRQQHSEHYSNTSTLAVNYPYSVLCNTFSFSSLVCVSVGMCNVQCRPLFCCSFLKHTYLLTSDGVQASLSTWAVPQRAEQKHYFHKFFPLKAHLMCKTKQYPANPCDCNPSGLWDICQKTKTNCSWNAIPITRTALWYLLISYLLG